MLEDDVPLQALRVLAATHFAISRSDPSKLGYVRLNRALWYSDLEHYRWHGVSITGLRTYKRTAQGPMADDILAAVSRLVKEGKVAERTVAVADYSRREMISLKEPDTSPLNVEQIVILERMTRLVESFSASRLREITISDPLWRELENDQAMLIATGSVISRLQDSDAVRAE